MVAKSKYAVIIGSLVVGWITTIGIFSIVDDRWRADYVRNVAEVRIQLDDAKSELDDAKERLVRANELLVEKEDLQDETAVQLAQVTKQYDEAAAALAEVRKQVADLLKAVSSNVAQLDRGVVALEEYFFGDEAKPRADDSFLEALSSFKSTLNAIMDGVSSMNQIVSE